MTCNGTNRCVPVTSAGLDCSLLGANCHPYQAAYRQEGCLCDVCPPQECETQAGLVTCSGFTTCVSNGSNATCEKTSFRTDIETGLALRCEPFSPRCRRGFCADQGTRACTSARDCDVSEICQGSSNHTCVNFGPSYPPDLTVCPQGCDAIPQPHQNTVLCDCPMCPEPPDAGPPTDAGSPDAGLPDAGPSDAGPPDAGQADAGPTTLPDAGALFPQGPPCSPVAGLGCFSGVCQRQYTYCGSERHPLETFACVPTLGGACSQSSECDDNYECNAMSATCQAIDCAEARGTCGPFAGIDLAYLHGCFCPNTLCAETPIGPALPPGQ